MLVRYFSYPYYSDDDLVFLELASMDIKIDLPKFLIFYVRKKHVENATLVKEYIGKWFDIFA